MGWSTTQKFIQLYRRRREHPKLCRGQPHKRWSCIRQTLNALIIRGRISQTLKRCKTLQPYAEELIGLAKKDTLRCHRLVESIIISARARRILYETLVPRYADRPGHYTRVIDSWEIRSIDSSRMGFLEYIGRVGEIRPAAPVGYDKKIHLYHVMENGTRRERRRLWKQAVLEDIIGPNGRLIDKNVALVPNKDYLWSLDSNESYRYLDDTTANKMTDNLDENDIVLLLENETLDARHKNHETEEEQFVETDLPTSIETFSPTALKYSGKKMIQKQSRFYEPFGASYKSRRKRKEFILPFRVPKIRTR